MYKLPSEQFEVQVKLIHDKKKIQLIRENQ